MNSRRLVSDALSGKPVPRPACGPLAVHVCARLAGIPVRDFSRDAALLARAVIRYHETFRPDAVWISADTWVTAEAMGAPVSSPAPGEPLVGPPGGIVRTMADVERIPPPDPLGRARQPVMVEALRRVRKALGDRVFIVACFDQSPFSLACALGGIERVMVKTIEEPAFVEALAAKAAAYAVSYGRSLAAAGLLGPALYERFALPWEKRVFESLRPFTSCPLSLHVCGDATALLPLMARSGADVLEIDHEVDAARACSVLPGGVALWGNIDPVGVLRDGSPGDVRRAAHAFVEAMKRAGRGRYVLSSGCTMAPDTPPENIHALIEAARA